MSSSRPDPLFDTLFRPTVAAEDLSSAAPVRAAGTHARGGNAMNRTRAALLEGARRAVADSGTKITMAQVALAAGVAKATLYNHFRTREAVLGAVLEDEVSRLVTLAKAEPDLRGALVVVASELSQSWMLRSLGQLDPATVLALARVDLGHDGWRAVRDAVREQLERAGVGGESTVLRWLSSFLLTPGDSASIAADVDVLIAGLH